MIISYHALLSRVMKMTPRGSLSRAIIDAPLPKGLEKPVNLGTYDNTINPDEHLEIIDALLDYCNVKCSIKCI